MGQLIKNDSIHLAALALQEGKIVAFPTETVYGLGIVYDNFASFVTLNRIKNRPNNQPYTLMLAKAHDIDDVAMVSDEARKLIDSFIPGEITLILPAKDNLPSWVVNKSDNTIGVRVPEMKFVCRLIHLTGKPLLVPSANRHGMEPLLSGKDVFNEFKDQVEYVFDGKSGGSRPSTIVRCCDTITIIREGNITKEQIEQALGRKL